MRMGWITHNSVGKQKFLTKNSLAGVSRSIIFCYLLDFLDIYHYHENTKQIKNGIKSNKRNQTCHIYHVNAWDAAYLISY